jgi:hypothetical protein
VADEAQRPADRVAVITLVEVDVGPTNVWRRGWHMTVNRRGPARLYEDREGNFWVFYADKPMGLADGFLSLQLKALELLTE